MAKTSCAAAADSAVLRYAALSAMHGVAKNYIAALASRWDSISHAVQLNVSSGSAPPSSGKALTLHLFLGFALCNLALAYIGFPDVT